MQTVFVFSLFEVKNRRLLHERGQFMTFYIHVPVYQPNQDLSYDFLFNCITVIQASDLMSILM